MSKYSYEFKMKAVQAYLNDEGSYEYLSKKYNLSDKHPLRIWVSSYKEFGKEDLMRSRQNKNYSLQFKLSVVELYLSSKVSYRELALSQGINNPSLIARWVNDFRMAGPDALRQKKKAFFLFLLAFTCPVGVVEFASPASAIVFEYRHCDSPFWCFVTVFYHKNTLYSMIPRKVDNMNNWWNNEIFFRAY